MQFSIFMLLAAGLVIFCASMCCCDPIRPMYERSENMSRPTRPKIFSTPEELKSYLEKLGNFYAIAGRPRFGKRALAPWMANYMREDPAVFRNLPISSTDLLQMLSSIAQNQENLSSNTTFSDSFTTLSANSTDGLEKCIDIWGAE